MSAIRQTSVERDQVISWTPSIVAQPLGGIGIFLLIIVGVWVLVDAFMLPGVVRRYKDARLP